MSYLEMFDLDTVDLEREVNSELIVDRNFDDTHSIKAMVSVLQHGVGACLQNPSFAEFFSNSNMNILLLCVPLAFAAKSLEWGESWLFIFSLIALCPLAERISFVTEDMVKYTNSTVGGLLNASFGNITELVVSIIALRQDKLWVVQVSLLGSILSNALLVLGTAFLVGGLKFKTQLFNQTAAKTNVSLMCLSVCSMLVPSILAYISTGDGEAGMNRDTEASILLLSRLTSVLLLVSYFLFLFFQLRTHTKLFEDADDEEEDEAPIFGFWGAITWLALLTCIVSFISEFIVDVIEKASEELNIPPMFVGAIILPIVGNAAEHAGAVIFAYKNKMAISIGISIGSVVQIALSVIPIMVLVAWVYDKPLSLDFHVYGSFSVFLTTIVVAFLVQDGKSNWLQGILLINVYIVLAMGFWTMKDYD